MVAAAIYSVTIFLVKAKIFLMLFHIFYLLRWMRYCVWFGIIFAALFYSSGVIVPFIMCGPYRGRDWLEASQTTRCMRLENYGLATGVVNILSDFYLLIIPIPAIWSLQMPTRKKVGVCAMFMTGLL